ncbi:MAG: hypothetical protein ACTHOD_01675 [Motilibacteraceae bacterium]
MRRRTFDTLMSIAGLAMAALLLVGGGLLTWAHTFVSDQVHTQLAAQQIYFPQAGSDALKSAETGPYLNQYAGQQLTTGAQAKAYADHFIAVHLHEMTGGQTYAQLSTKAMANPADTKLAGQVATVFKGETLRGLLLNAYAFWTMGQIALYAAIAAFAGAALFLALGILGLIHRGHTPTDAELLLGSRQPAPVER